MEDFCLIFESSSLYRCMTQEEFTYRASEMRAKSVAMAKRFGYAEGDADDIAQDVMLKLWCLHEDIRDENHLKASVTISTKQMCIDRWRTQHSFVDIDESLAVVDEGSFSDPLEYAELEQWLNEQIDKLPSTSGIVLRMRQLERRELSEIAVILGIQQSSVSTLLSRARNELLNKLKKRNAQ